MKTRVALSVGLVLAAVSASAFEFARDGNPVAALVANGHAEPAALLRRYVAAISGAELSAAEDAKPGAPVVVLEVTNTVPGLSDRPTALQGYRIVATRDRLTLSARSERGLTYAVYGLLEDHCGARFFAADCEVVPKRKTLTVAALDETREPAIQVRSTFLSLNGTNPWEIANRGGGLPADILISRHGFYDWVHPSKYLELHPEWFPLLAGKRQQHWLHGLCYSNPDLAGQMASNIVERIRKGKLPAAVPIPVGQGDGFVACQCETCRAVAKENDSEAGPVILLLNRVLDAMRAEFPNHQLITFAYAQTIRTPKNIRPHPNLWINIVSSSAGGEGWGPLSGGDMIGAIRNNPANDLYRQATEQWTKVAPGRVTIWHWSTDFGDQSVEWPNLFTMADNIRFWREQGVAAVALQTTGGGGNWGWLKHWVWLKLMWSPDADIDALAREFLTGYYGPKAAPILWEYHQFVEQTRQKSDYAANACDYGANNALAMHQKLFPTPLLARMDALLDQATQAALKEKDPVYAQRVEHARAYAVDELKLVEAAGVKPYPGGYFYPPESVKLSRIRDPRDGSFWLVPGTTPDMPARVDRRDQAMKTTGAQDWGAAYMTRFWFQRGAGGRLTRLENPALAVEICPNLLGTIASIVHKRTGKELLAGRFPLNEFYCRSTMEWRILEASPHRAAMAMSIQNDNWFFQGDQQRYLRTLELADTAPALQITRAFAGEKPGNAPGMHDPMSFGSVWTFQAPDPAGASVTVTVRGERTVIPVREKGEKTVPLPKPATELVKDKPAADAGGQPAGGVVIELDRGDGLLVTLTTPAAGWTGVTVTADPEGKTVGINLGGVSLPMTREANRYSLPGIRLDVGEKKAGG